MATQQQLQEQSISPNGGDENKKPGVSPQLIVSAYASQPLDTLPTEASVHSFVVIDV